MRVITAASAGRAERRCDLLVVGAGPAGCAAAVAARAAAPALTVLVVDAARFPREKLCGGAITGGGLRELALAGLALRVRHAVATHAVLRAGGVARRVELPEPAVTVRRVELDHDLVAQARAAGADVVEGARLRGLRGDVADTAAGPVRFRSLVAADGASTAARRALGLPAGRRAPLREALVAGARQRDLVFDLDAAAEGYAWRFPCLDAGRPAENVGAYSLAGARAAAAGLARFAAQEALPLEGVEAGALRLFEPRGAYGVRGALLAGEALGADPLVGEGIRYALWSGRIAGALAARALARGRRPSPAAYRAALAATRSGATLALAALLAPRLHGGDPRWRALASDPSVARALAALASGAAPLGPVLALLGRFAALGRAPRKR
jgi:menaquinone-9 beta-reductase